MVQGHETTVKDFDNDELLSRLVLADKESLAYKELRAEALERMKILVVRP